ncbi:HD domain-containing protein [Fusobacterium sp. PH5-44]|uniref:HD domain-containing protein n=1 Tax=unclassified Fusobacterium TaxID=2648384 RepID=UPI003D252F2D
MSAINLEKARVVFNDYVSNYDLTNEKIRLKVAHTYKVMNLSEKVAQSLNISIADIELARLIGLLHDIGRFEQVKLHNTFDDTVFPHSEYGIKVLFEENHIRDYIDDTQYDNIIYNAIKNHSSFKLDEESFTANTLMHCKIIRDADKLDIFRVILEENIKTISKISKKQFEKDYISDNVYNDILEYKSILRSQRHTSIDVVVSFIGFVFDINYKYSFEYLLENGYIKKIIDSIGHTEMETKEKLLKIKKVAENYCREKRNGIFNE